MRVATERSLGKDALGKDSGERIVYVKGNKAQRDAALDMIKNNPKVRAGRHRKWMVMGGGTGGQAARARALCVCPFCVSRVRRVVSCLPAIF